MNPSVPTVILFAVEGPPTAADLFSRNTRIIGFAAADGISPPQPFESNLAQALAQFQHRVYGDAVCGAISEDAPGDVDQSRLVTQPPKRHRPNRQSRNHMPSQTAKVVRAQTAIDIDADGVIIVGNSAAVAPHGRTVQEVVDRVQKRAGWIVKQRGYFDQVHPLLPPRRFVAGETRLYLGRQYRLKLIEDAATCVKFNGRFLWVHFRATLGGQLDWQEGGSGAFHTTSRHNPLVSGVS